MTGVVDQLVSAGWVERATDPEDRRAVRLTITDEGRTTLAAAQKTLVEAATELMEGLSDDEIDALIKGLEGLDAALADRRTCAATGTDQTRDRSRSAS